MLSKLIKLIYTFLALLIIVCCTDPIKDHPVCWEYSPGKWVAFKTGIEIEWGYDETNIDKFKIEIGKIKLSTADILSIKSLIHRKNINGLIEKENSLRNEINFNKKIVSFQSSTKINFKDTDDQKPAFGEIRFYQVTAMENFTTSLPAGLSVMLIDRSK